MRDMALAIVAVGFFALIGVACWVTHSADPLLALLLLAFLLIGAG